MACGMVLVIVSRNIDLSVGSIVGLTGYVMAMVQAVWIPTTLNLGFNQPYTWFIALAVGLLLGAAIGAFQGLIIAYGKVPSFIVTLGGLLVWRGLVFEIQQGQTISPLDKTFDIIGGGLPNGAIGAAPSWALGIVGCILIVYAMVSSRRKRASFGFPVRPLWALVALTAAGCVAIMGAVWVANAYMWPAGLATEYAQAHGITEPDGGLQIPVGIAAPVLIVLAVTLGVTFLATRRKFGRYVFAIGGNPEAAELGGINTRFTILKTFTLMGILSAVSGAIYTARLDSGVTSLGTGDELAVIAAAVIGGTSFAGGIGTIPGAVMGAVVMQSLRSGMILLKVDSPVQDIVVGAVLVAAVGLDVFLHRRRAS
jgi:D-xylose transport system permease protein